MPGAPTVFRTAETCISLEQGTTQNNLGSKSASYAGLEVVRTWGPESNCLTSLASRGMRMLGALDRAFLVLSS